MSENNKTILTLLDNAKQLGVQGMEEISQVSTYIEFSLIVCVLVASYFVANKLLRRIFKENPDQAKIPLWRQYLKLLPYLAIVIGLWGVYIAYEVSEYKSIIVRPIAVIATSWLFIQAITVPLKEGMTSSFIRYSGWLIMLLWLFNLIESTIQVLRDLSFEMGDFSISVFDFLSAVIIILVLFWLAAGLSKYLDQTIRRTQKFTPSIKVLFSKLVTIGIYAAAIILSANALGLDLTALAIFGGALGVGIGLGLQKIVANFISGIILLLDKSIKPGDVITVGNTYGWVSHLKTRYASVKTRGGVEYLIPNENLITQEVINWTHSDNNVRIQIAVGVSYSSDMREVERICVDAAKSVKRVLSDPSPICLMAEFGDNSVNFLLRFWISDPEGGMSNVKSQVYFAVWEGFKKGNIEIPFPQRVLHIDKESAKEVFTN